jgi:hypothetical protein
MQAKIIAPAVLAVILLQGNSSALTNFARVMSYSEAIMSVGRAPRHSYWLCCCQAKR